MVTTPSELKHSRALLIKTTTTITKDSNQNIHIQRIQTEILNL